MFKCDVCKCRVEFAGTTTKNNKSITICLKCMKVEKENATKKTK